ncbi:hypothetical protein ALC53_04173 [Atta colombica]|uniref:Uncharacterized protein n=1 Tax=Atta colombica TaxID=520822 RepID=A0A195BMF0_9HYME|nr:hypothetical protein ALC53_04173 [Atta colombica]
MHIRELFRYYFAIRERSRSNSIDQQSSRMTTVARDYAEKETKYTRLRIYIPPENHCGDNGVKIRDPNISSFCVKYTPAPLGILMRGTPSNQITDPVPTDWIWAQNQFSHYAQSYILSFLQHARNSGKHSDRHYLTCRSFFSRSGGPDWLSTKWAAISVKNVLRCTRMLIYAGASKKRKKGDAQIERAFSDAPPSMAVSAGNDISNWIFILHCTFALLAKVRSEEEVLQYFCEAMLRAYPSRRKAFLSYKTPLLSLDPVKVPFLCLDS